MKRNAPLLALGLVLLLSACAAILIPNEDIGAQRPEALPQLDATLLVYCRTGVRSKQASDKLIELGYENVYDMGGIVDWSYDTVTGSDAG